MLQINLRRAQPSDIPQLQKLFEESIRSRCANDYNEEQLEAWALTAKNQDRWSTAVSEQYFLLAEIGNVLAGFASLKQSHYIDFMYASDRFQGKGVANTLLAAIEAQAFKQGAKVISSDISKTARPFFEKKGYRIEKENENWRNGILLINYRMSKHLQ